MVTLLVPYALDEPSRVLHFSDVHVIDLGADRVDSGVALRLAGNSSEPAIRERSSPRSACTSRISSCG